MAKPRVAIIEDLWEVHLLVFRYFGDRVEILSACCSEDGILILQENVDRLDAIAIDARLPRTRDHRDRESELNGLCALDAAKKLGYKCPVISISGHPELRGRFLSQGCTHACERKRDLPEKLSELLAISP